jgi:hypothetical protein
MRKFTLINTQKIRAKLIIQLQGIFDLAMSIAKGKVKQLQDDDDKEYRVTPQQRQKWAKFWLTAAVKKLSAYAA